MLKLKLENIGKVYTDNNYVALKDINLEFESGKFYSIIGPSGSGKTTLLQIIGTIDKQTTGKYFFNNIDIEKMSERKKSNFRMEEIGFVFQNYYLNKNLRAIDNVILPMYINKKIHRGKRRYRASELLGMVGLLEKSNHYPSELSGGESQRVAIARALANEPNVILADEPTGNLDKENERIVLNLLKKLSEDGKCVIVVSHSNEIREYADQIIKLDNGMIAGIESVYK